MIKVEILIAEAGGKASVKATPMIPEGTKPTPLERAAWLEMKARIFANVIKPKGKKSKK